MYALTRIYPFSKIGENIYFHAKRGEKKIALTFDDGPSKNTEKVLEILKKYNFKGTFFVLGKKVKRNKKILQEIIESGSEIGNHSYNHPSLIFKSKKFIRREIQKTDEELKKLNIKTNFFRPPHGSWGFNLASTANQLTKKIILWDVDPSDWSKPEIKKAIHHILSNSKCGSIIDLHDFAEGIGENNNLIKILNRIIPELKNRGYKLVTVSELFKF